MVDVTRLLEVLCRDSLLILVDEVAAEDALETLEARGMLVRVCAVTECECDSRMLLGSMGDLRSESSEGIILVNIYVRA